jgi:RNA polymerase sigma factor (sigma-70 family)
VWHRTCAEGSCLSAPCRFGRAVIRNYGCRSFLSQKSLKTDVMTLPLDELLDRLCDGDATAAERVFVEFEPYLRKAIRRQLGGQLRRKFDSADILQSVWVDLLRGFRDRAWRFADADQLRGFLFVATRNRLIDRSRKYQNASREEPLDEDKHPGKLVSSQPRPSETVQAADLWNRLVASCPPEHRRLLYLRREGHSLSEIAASTGLHRDSVRRILRTLAGHVAFAQSGSTHAVRGASP